MSALTNQTAINSGQDFFLKVLEGNTIPFATPLVFDTNQDGSTQGRLIGNLSTLFIQSDNTVTLSKTALIGGVQAQFNFNATQQNGEVGLYVSSPIFTDTLVAGNNGLYGNIQVSSINGLAQNPPATRFGFFEQTAAGTGVTAVANNQVLTSSIILVQPIGSTAPQTSTISYYANPVAGVGFTSIASRPLDNPQNMSYYVLKW